MNSGLLDSALPKSPPLGRAGLCNLLGILFLLKVGIFLPFLHIGGVPPGAPSWLSDLQYRKGDRRSVRNILKS